MMQENGFGLMFEQGVISVAFCPVCYLFPSNFVFEGNVRITVNRPAMH